MRIALAQINPVVGDLEGNRERILARLAEARDTLDDVIEPYLIQEGLMLRTSRGRMLGEPGWRHLGLMPPSTVPGQPELLDLLTDPE